MNEDRETLRRERRLAMKRFMVAGGSPLLFGAYPAHSLIVDDGSTNSTNVDTDRAFMAQAQAMKVAAVAAGDQSYGAIVVKDSKIVGEGPSRVVTNRDPTAHAEVEAIRDACKNLGTRDLSGCVLYGTSTPCRMCETASYWANISRFVYGVDVIDGGRPSYSSC